MQNSLVFRPISGPYVKQDRRSCLGCTVRATFPFDEPQCIVSGEVGRALNHVFSAWRFSCRDSIGVQGCGTSEGPVGEGRVNISSVAVVRWRTSPVRVRVS